MKIKLLTILLIALAVVFLCACNKTDVTPSQSDATASDTSDAAVSEVPSESSGFTANEGANAKADAESSSLQASGGVSEGGNISETEANSAPKAPDTTDSTQENAGEPEINFADLM